MLFKVLNSRVWAILRRHGHTIIKMPALSPTMTQGSIGPWKKKEGDSVAVGDVLCEIETDKAQMEFESPEEGWLARILRREGEKEVEVGRQLAVIVDDKKFIDDFKDYQGGSGDATGAETKTSPEHVNKADQPSQTPSQSAQTLAKLQPQQGQKASPLARVLAREHGVDLDGIHGSGPNGRIVKRDILKSDPSRSESVRVSTPPLMHSTSGYKDIPVSGVRRVIAERLSYSMQSVPHYYITSELNMHNILKARVQLNAQLAHRNMKLSLNDFVIKAAALALMEVPTVNSSWMDHVIRQYEQADVCVAVATQSGLITPIIHDCSKMSLLQIASKSKELAEKARASKLKPEEFQGGTFTISNLGMYSAVSSFTAIINPPQAAILAVGSADIDGRMHVTLSCDHRVVDGAVGAEWMGVFKAYMEDPYKLLL